MRLDIYVPTRGRIDQQKAMEFFRLKKVHEKGHDRVTFVTARCEAAAFKRKYSWARVKVVDDDWKTGTISQKIARWGDWRWKVWIDDDMQLLRRRDKLSISQKGGSATDADAFAAFDRIRHWLKKGYVHGSFSMRQVNHFCTDGWFKENCRACGLLFFDTRYLRLEKIRFDALQERQDFHVVLSLLELGYANIVDYEFIVGQYISGTNAPGGCSRYRTHKYMVEQTERLVELHPDTVKMTWKQLKDKNVQHLTDDDGKIPDVRVQWVKSYGLHSEKRRANNTKGIVCSG